MPLYRKVPKCASSKVRKSSKRDISPDLFSSTQASECSTSSNNSTDKKIVKSLKSFKAPSVVGFKTPALDFVDYDDSIITAATPEKDSNASPHESASFDRGNVDKNDKEFFGEINETIDSEQFNITKSKMKNNKNKERKTNRTDTKEHRIYKGDDCVEKNEDITKNKFNKKNFEIVKKRKDKTVHTGEDIAAKISKEAKKLKKDDQMQKSNQKDGENSQNSQQCSQGSSHLYVEALKRRMAVESQEYTREPPDGPSVTQRERLEWFQRERDVGLYVHCDVLGCDKMRYLANVKDPLELEDKWYCYMNPDPKYNDCTKAEQSFNLFLLDDMIENKYNAGSVVWARLIGYPWWPAMVDDCPDTETFYWLDDDNCTIPSWYNVTFFDEKQVTRAWLRPNDIRPFEKDLHSFDISPSSVMKKLYGARLAVAKKQAIETSKIPLIERLIKFSFLSRYAGKIRLPIDKLKKKTIGNAQKISNNLQCYKSKGARRNDLTDGVDFTSESESFSFKGRKITEEEMSRSKNKTTRKSNKSQGLLHDNNQPLNKNKRRVNKKFDRRDMDLISESSIEETSMVNLAGFLERKSLKRKSTLLLAKNAKKHEKTLKSVGGNLSNHRYNEDELNISSISGCSNLSLDNSMFV